jgi:hypothetical protein
MAEKKQAKRQKKYLPPKLLLAKLLAANEDAA